MKIALVVFRIGPSHGSILQTYALYQILCRWGHEVTVLNRQNNPSIYRYLRNAIARIKDTVLFRYNGPIFYTTDYSPLTMKELKLFFQKYLSVRTLTFRKKCELDRITQSDYDCYIVGSDQTWRPKFVYDVRYYFLNFLSSNHPAKRIAYAPSFGTSDWEYSPQLTEECKGYLSKFSAVSVREDDGVELCKKYFGVQATHVLDPTMLLKREDYISLIDTSGFERDKLLAFSILDKSKLAIEIIRRVSHKLRINPYQINASHNSPAASWVEPGIDKWLGGIFQSKFVVTDSFHATVFSIILNRPFVTIVNVSRGTSRIKSLLAMFGLEDRMISSLNQLTDDMLFGKINWESVNNILDTERDKSLKWLKNALDKENVKQ